ncbi:MAG: NAD+ synthase [bacterium]
MRLPDIDVKKVRKALLSFISREFERSPFEKAILGISGGIDSAVVAYLVSEALDNQTVIGLLMPYRTQPKDVVEDALEVINNLSIQSIIVDISPMIDSFLSAHFDEDRRRIGSKMARERMSLLYYYADLFNAMVFGTGNRSEALLGYFSKHGDVGCDIMPLNDLYKTDVVRLALELGVPRKIIDKKPSAGFWPEQTDEAELGFSYQDGDEILYQLIDKKRRENDLHSMGFEKDLVTKVTAKGKTTEYKRKPPIVPNLRVSRLGE